MPKRSDELGLFADSEQHLPTSTTDDCNRARTVAAGALHMLKLNWAPGSERSQLRSALIAACLLSLGLGLLLLLPAAMAITSSYSHRQICHPLARTSFGHDNEESTNVYFLKHENRSWTSEELCHIETAARRYPEFNILMINLRGTGNRDQKHNWNFEFSNLAEANDLHDNENVIESSKKENSRILSNRLMEIPNVVNFDVELRRFFAGSALAKEIENLDGHDIETAARFQAIWDAPGISLDPLGIHQLQEIRDLDGRRRKEAMVSVQIESDFQATSVPCHSFIGQIINEISKGSFMDRKTALEHVLENFCPSGGNCSGVRVIDPSSTNPGISTTCPIVDSANAKANRDKISSKGSIPQGTLGINNARENILY
ncbi:hypothetical protein QAD02_006006 [Eretmocerus hayati]|uniref:Uncharacterized protein n=1 Tax=Eretmocerus hayati TaxID=131215 RepID=A0ACC2MZU8_9HYME|nr:hypothetical protein QAD02_006006 [Eretmocerus hayati]